MTVPFAEESEKVIIALILSKPDVYLVKAKSENITDEHFYSPAYKLIFKTVLSLEEKGATPDDMVVLQELMDNDDLDRIGGPAEFSDLLNYRVLSSSWDSNIETIKDRAGRRRTQMGSQELLESLGDMTAKEQINALRRLSESVMEVSSVGIDYYDTKKAIGAFGVTLRDRLEKKEDAGLSTGITHLDMIGGGMRPGEFWVICGGTSSGKSALSYQAALPAILDNKNVIIFTLEMGVEEVMGRMVSASGGIHMADILEPWKIDKGGLGKITRTVESFKEQKVKIFDDPGISIDFVCAQCETINDEDPVDLVIVDYIQLLEGENRKGENREQELSRISRRLKQLAKRLQCPIISPSQLNDNGKIRESRAIGQDADVVLFINEEGIEVGKNRNGARGQNLPLRLNGGYQRFEFDPELVSI